MIASLVALALLCPYCETLRAAAEPEKAVDLVFLPDGFEADQMPLFRCLTDFVAARLQEAPPFNDASGFFNVHRVDLVSPEVSGLAHPDCSPSEACERDDPILPAACAGDLSAWTRPSDATGAIPTLRLGAELCGGGSHTRCEFMSLSDDMLAEAVIQAQMAPAVDIVVVLVNAGTAGGVAKPAPGYTGPMTLYEGSPPVVVVTLDGIESSDPIVGNGCANRLAHEIGHAFGLVDEYDTATFVDGASAGEPPCGPNVTDPTSPVCDPPIPWGGVCTVHDAVSCANRGPIEECRISTVEHCCPEPDPDPDPQTSTYTGELPDSSAIGLFEGAYYQECGYYRPTDVCRMRINAEPFCPVCLAAMRERLQVETECIVMNLRGAIATLEAPEATEARLDVKAAAVWTDPFFRGLQDRRARRFRGLVDLGGVKAWVPLNEVEIESGEPSPDSGKDGRARVRIERRLRGLEPRFDVTSHGLTPPQPPEPGVPPPLPVPPKGPPPLTLPKVRVDVRDIIGEARQAHALEFCFERKPVLP